jgi:hypothetical protein
MRATIRINNSGTIKVSLESLALPTSQIPPPSQNIVIFRFILNQILLTLTNNISKNSFILNKNNFVLR